jgi:hypothetical protein
MKDELTSFWDGATFLPHDQPSRSDLLREKVWKSREAAFLVFGLKLSATEPELYRNSCFGEIFENFKSLTLEERRGIIEYPPFMIWLKQSIRPYSSQLELKNRLAELNRVLASLKQTESDTHLLRVAGSPIWVARFDIDPLIAAASFPEYKFPDQDRRREFEEKVVYPLTFFRKLVTVALERVERAWPEAHRDFFKFVRIIVDMVDGEFTSYSACDHMGVIFVSTDNSPLVALEEYLLHEFGHQVLYNVMELDPIVVMENPRIFKLPWSDNERDFYGYFHAFFIYLLLANYLERVTGRSQREYRRITARRKHIIKGLILAIPELESADSFTPRGRQLFENLKADVRRLNMQGDYLRAADESISAYEAVHMA